MGIPILGGDGNMDNFNVFSVNDQGWYIKQIIPPIGWTAVCDLINSLVL